MQSARPSRRALAEMPYTILRSLEHACSLQPSVIVSLSSLRLVLLNQIADALRVRLAVPMARNGIGAASRFDHDLGPDDARRNVYRRDLRDRNALFIAAKQSRLGPDHALRAHDESRRKKEIPLRPPRRRKGFSRRRIHPSEIRRSHWIEELGNLVIEKFENNARITQLPNYQITQSPTPTPARPSPRPTRIPRSGSPGRSASPAGQTARRP